KVMTRTSLPSPASLAAFIASRSETLLSSGSFSSSEVVTMRDNGFGGAGGEGGDGGDGGEGGEGGDGGTPGGTAGGDGGEGGLAGTTVTWNDSEAEPSSVPW